MNRDFKYVDFYDKRSFIEKNLQTSGYKVS